MTPDPHEPASTSAIEFGNLEANCRFLCESGALVPGRRVLEIGTGRGSMLDWLGRQGMDAVGIEIRDELVRDARRRHPDLAIVRASGTALPFADASFDLVVSFDVFEHIADSDGHLRDVTRVLRPGGEYLLQTPNKWTNSVFETIRWRSFTRWRVDHCALHSHAGLTRRFARHGYALTFLDVPVVTPFFREKVRRHLGAAGVRLLALAQPDRWPAKLRTNFYVRARR